MWPRWHAVLGLVVAVIGLLAPFALPSATNGAEWLSALVFPALLILSLASAVLMIRHPVRDPAQLHEAPLSVPSEAERSAGRHELAARGAQMEPMPLRDLARAVIPYT